MLVAAGFALLKLLRSFFAKTIEFERGRSLFHRTIQAIRTTSVAQNDLQSRLAELMVQMWNGARLDSVPEGGYNPDDSSFQIDDSLQLKVRCRHSMSLVFDSIWRWREEYQALGRGSLDALKQPTNPDSANESSASSTHLDNSIVNAANTNTNPANATLMPSHALHGGSGMLTANGGLTPGASGLSVPVSAATTMLGGLGYAGAGAEAGYDFSIPSTGC
ncbi:unnamed protein product [Parascedosporium putredinis]|uniref:Uncharacterized protein n=1 Tax=Parascedosporium putredinis TaxID=1442378 RepID=A0A9P1HB30_9PEZI|nr:unnamed protein product [Parascedosporium putredinis]CAI8003300.1 unnamed protein product [Parascedosporium putredinis]